MLNIIKKIKQMRETLHERKLKRQLLANKFNEKFRGQKTFVVWNAAETENYDINFALRGKILVATIQHKKLVPQDMKKIADYFGRLATYYGFKGVWFRFKRPMPGRQGYNYVQVYEYFKGHVSKVDLSHD
jgi:hypothetical protein